MTRIFRPLADNILVNPIPLKSVTDSGVVFLFNESHKVQRGIVLSMGPGTKGITREIRIGDMILFPFNGGLNVKMNNHEYVIISEQKLIAVI